MVRFASHFDGTCKRRCVRAAVTIAAVLIVSTAMGSILATTCALYAGRDEDGVLRWDMLARRQSVSEPGFGLMLVRSFFLTSALLPLALLGPLAFASSLFRSHVF
eukprot:TRINITY_DN111265_c0_g1_i1.p1 TRINITY_DN111265_c0_g1~~TRINITY_DN111265_c0_g1_i1.p1  ORF type:complete len:105 (+),score=8.47 TRINITY_DN111265_c0_g1_i1:94-408(+)